MADQMQPTPRSTVLGLFSDLVNLPLQYMSQPERTQQSQGVAQFLYGTGIPKTLERMSYGDSLFSGAGGLGGTTRMRPETADALMNVAPLAPAAGRVANQAAMNIGRAGEKLAERVVPQVMSRGGLPAQLLGDVSKGSMSPAVQLGSDFLGKKPPTPEQLAKVSDKFLYHSSTADKANDLLYGIEPQAGGNWVREVAQGAVEGNLDDFFSNVTPLSWFSDNPSWIKAMVGRKLNKPFNKVTIDDIEKHGHLAIINKKSPSAQDIYFLPEQGLNEGAQSTVYDIQGNPKKAWQTDLYQEGNYGQRMEPFGTEKNEYVSAKTVDPFIQLTGKELVAFMKAKGLIEKNKFIPPQQAALDLAQQRAALPVEQGGLGLPANNTAMDRARHPLMQFTSERYHETEAKNIPTIANYDVRRPVAGASDEQTPYGMFVKPSGARIGVAKEGETQIPLLVKSNLTDQNVMRSFMDREDLQSYLNQFPDLKKATSDVRNLDNQMADYIAKESERAFALQDQGKTEEADKILAMFNANSNVMQEFNKQMAEKTAIAKDLITKHFQDKKFGSVGLVNDQGAFGKKAITEIVLNPENVRSRFAAFDPFRKDVATATAMGVALPDLLAQPVRQYELPQDTIPMYTDPFGNTIGSSIR